MKHDVSSLMDGELGPEESSRVLDAMQHNRELQEAWSIYHLLGDVLRNAPSASPLFADKVMARIRKEPVVLLPETKKPPLRPIQLAYPLAAVLAGIGVVAWVALSFTSAKPTDLVSSPTGQVAFRQTPPSPPVSVSSGGNLKEYLMAHELHSANGGIQGVAPYVRTVTEIRQVAPRP